MTKSYTVKRENHTYGEIVGDVFISHRAEGVQYPIVNGKVETEQNIYTVDLSKGTMTREDGTVFQVVEN